MLERYFVRPETVDRVRASWIGGPIEQYVGWLTEKKYTVRSICRRVPILMRFGEFARGRGAATWEELPAHVKPFVAAWVEERGRRCVTERESKGVASSARTPIEQMLRLVLPDFVGTGRPRRLRDAFADRAPGFFRYLRHERGLRPASLDHYRYNLVKFEGYLERIGLGDLRTLSPIVLSSFVTESSGSLSQSGIQAICRCLRVFLRYLHREGHVADDLSRTVECPMRYRLANVPRSIPWGDVQKMLGSVDRRGKVGKRDYAILALLVTYGLRAREVAALTLDDIDWNRERLMVPERKAGHSTAYPLSAVVGEAILDYLRSARPETLDRHVFIRAIAPQTPLTGGAVSARVAHYLRKAGISVPLPGSHTLRHTCVQRLLDSGFPLKTIGDYVGHRSYASTEIYSKVSIEELREVAMGDAEDIL